MLDARTAAEKLGENGRRRIKDGVCLEALSNKNRKIIPYSNVPVKGNNKNLCTICFHSGAEMVSGPRKGTATALGDRRQGSSIAEFSANGWGGSASTVENAANSGSRR